MRSRSPVRPEVARTSGQRAGPEPPEPEVAAERWRAEERGRAAAAGRPSAERAEVGKEADEWRTAAEFPVEPCASSGPAGGQC
jgi:hypothetical protein